MKLRQMKLRRMKLRWMVIGGLVGLAALRQRHQGAPVPLKDQVVIVTGASSGIGREAALAFAAQGAKLVLTARRRDALNEVKAQAESECGAAVRVIAGDITDDGFRQALVAGALDAFGRIDVLVNNAGQSTGGLFHEQDPDRLRGVVETNLYAALRLAQLVLPHFIRQGAGRIVNVSSVIGAVPAPGLAGYAATRTGLAGFNDALRRELAGTGVGVSLVMPTWTRTPLIGDTAAVIERTFMLPVDDPRVPAAAIVDAVRFRRRRVILGGLPVRLAAWAERLAPAAVDWVLRRFIVTPEYYDAAKRFGS